MIGWLSTIILLFAAVGPPARTLRTVPRPRTAAVDPLVFGGISGMTATPGAINFQATDPDTGVVSGNSTGSVTWRASSLASGSWSLTIQAPAATFPGCATVPVSAVRVGCSSATVSGSGSASCSGPATLSTSPQTLATGSEGVFNLNATYTVNLTFTLTDSWKYIAQLSPQCSLTFTYTATLN